MIISARSQLGLRMMTNPDLLAMLQAKKSCLNWEHDYLQARINEEEAELSKKLVELGGDIKDWADNIPSNSPKDKKVSTRIFEDMTSGKYGELFKTGKYVGDEFLFLITKGVEDCSKMIKIGDYFSTTAFKNMKYGAYRYLLGKNEAVWMTCQKGIISGLYYHDLNKICFEFGFDLDNDKYHAPNTQNAIFNRIAKIITFIELGDIETVYLPAGRNNGKSKKSGGKITNTTEFNVYVVDTSWNKLIIRTEGFGVMGHFRLQPCGPGHVDRKLIWIDSFEKHGYVRKPRAAVRD